MPSIGQYAVDHELPSDLLSEINEELNGLGFPEVKYSKSYVRTNNNIQGIHIDGAGEPLHAAINIPLKGCNDSKHIYYTGSYNKTNVVRHNLKYYELTWNSTPVATTTLCLTSPHLLRVDEPHSAVAGSTEERWIFTMRFVGNPTFEDLYAKLTKEKI